MRSYSYYYSKRQYQYQYDMRSLQGLSMEFWQRRIPAAVAGGHNNNNNNNNYYYYYYYNRQQHPHSHPSTTTSTTRQSLFPILLLLRRNDHHHHQQQQQHHHHHRIQLFSSTTDTDVTTPDESSSSSSSTEKVFSASSSSFSEEDEEVQAFVTKLTAIDPTTTTSKADDRAVEKILEESWSILQMRLLLRDKTTPSSSSHHSTTTTTTTTTLIRTMQQLVDAWYLVHLRNGTMPRTSRPFQILLEAWSLVSFTNSSSSSEAAAAAAAAGSQACEALKRWYELLGGDLELAPTMAEFNQVLAAYAATSTNLHLAQRQQLLTYQDNNTSLRAAQIATEAWDVVKELKQWGYTMEPTMETNAYLVRCLKNVIVTSQRRQQQTQEASLGPDVAWDRLNQVMKDAASPAAAKYQKKPAKSLLFKTRPSQDTRELLFLTQATCDALIAARQFIPSRNTFDLYAPTCQKWGAFLRIMLLENREGTGAILDFGEANHLPYHATNIAETCNDLPSAFLLLAEGCEAWQFMLHHYYSQQQQQEWRTNAAYEISDILKGLEEIGSRYPSSSCQRQVYHALLRSYLLAIKAWENAIASPQIPNDRKEVMQLRDDLLHRLEAKHFDFVSSEQRNAGGKWLERVTASWNTLLSAKFHVGKVDQIPELWKDMRANQIAGDSVTYGIVLKALADSTHSNAAPTAHSIWKKMVSAWKRNPKAKNIPKPTGRHYASVIIAWSRSPHQDAGERALEVLRQMERDYEMESKQHREDVPDSIRSLKPTSVHFSGALKALGRTAGRHKQKLDVLHTEIYDLIDRMLTMPDSSQNNVAYGAALGALAKIGTAEAANLAQRILDDLEWKWRQDRRSDMRPTAGLYGSCMLAWSKAAQNGEIRDAYTHVEALLLRLESEYKEANNDPSLLPDSIVYCALLNSVIASGKTDLADRAEEILLAMEDKAASGLAARPEYFVYDKVITAHQRNARYDCGEKAEAILDRMKEAYLQEGNMAAKPNVYTYAAVMNAWSRSPSSLKAKQAARLLSEMQAAFQEGHIDIKPNIASYVAVLQCCAHMPVDADGDLRQEAARIALQSIFDLEKLGEQPTHVMYPLLFKAVNHLEDKLERKRTISILFEKCCRQGLVEPSVLAVLQQVSPEFYRNLPGGGKNIHALPKAWTRNSRQKNQ